MTSPLRLQRPRCPDPRCQLTLGHAGLHWAREVFTEPGLGTATYTDEWGDYPPGCLPENEEAQ